MIAATKTKPRATECGARGDMDEGVSASPISNYTIMWAERVDGNPGNKTKCIARCDHSQKFYLGACINQGKNDSTTHHEKRTNLIEHKKSRGPDQ
jgi:hypothetical protein